MKMVLLPIKLIEINQKIIYQIDHTIKSIYRLIIYDRHHPADDLLDAYMGSIHNLEQLVVIKNAQMEAQTEEKSKKYLKNLNKSLEFVVEEISTNVDFQKEVQLFQLLRIISPEANAVHPNRYRQNIVQVGSHSCPDPVDVPNLVSELFYQMKLIKNPIIKAIYLHHELVRIHPFVDGNGRVTRIAKNWLLLFNLYPPIFINDEQEKKEYIDTLAESFKAVSNYPNKWNDFTVAFFDQELKRLLINTNSLYNALKIIAGDRINYLEFD